MLFVTRDAFTKIEPVSHDISKSVEIEPNGPRPSISSETGHSLTSGWTCEDERNGCGRLSNWR